MASLRPPAVSLSALLLALASLSADGATPPAGRRTALPARRTQANGGDSYVRIVFDEQTDFCVGRADGNAVYCSSEKSQPSLCSSGSSVDFVKKFVVLEGPEGQCLADIEGIFTQEANFDSRKIIGRLPILHQSKKYCKGSYKDGKWVENGQKPNDASLYRSPSPVPPNIVSYLKKDLPYAKLNLTVKPELLCVGRDGSKVIYCAEKLSAEPRCPGANFVNFDLEFRTQSREMDDCYTRKSGYYDLLVELDGEGKIRGLPSRDKDLGRNCFHEATVIGREQAPPCTSDGRRCRP